ncbi:MAG: hypothetical protein EOO81_01005, partial [Oxalobacteraceae bacterium]
GDGVVRTFQAAGNLLGGLAAAAAVAGGDFSAAVRIARDASSQIDAILNRELFSTKLDKRIADMKAKANTPDPKPIDRPDLNFKGATEVGKKDTTAAQEAKARLDSDLAAIKNATDAVTNAYANQEKLLEAMRSAGLKDEGVYYEEKGRLLALNVAAQDNALQKQIARLRQESLTGKDQIDSLKKIAGVEADLAKLRENAATNTQVLGIQQTDALKKIAEKFNAAEAAARAYVDAISNQNGRELAGMGMGNLQRDKADRLAQREDALQARREGLTGQLSAGQITQADYDKYLAIQEAAHKRALASDTAYWEAKAAKQGSWVLGAQQGLIVYYEESQKIYDQVQKAGLNAFKGLEDALVSFTSTGKLSFTSLIDSMISDIARIVVKQQITGPLAKALGEGGKDGGFFGVIGTYLSQAFGGKRATGGNVSPNTMYQVNENGPELLNYNGKQYLMNGDKNGQITANGKLGGGGSDGGIEINVHNNVGAATAEVQQTPTEDGGMRLDIILRAVEAHIGGRIASGAGPVSRGIENRFGSRTATR